MVAAGWPAGRRWAMLVKVASPQQNREITVPEITVSDPLDYLSGFGNEHATEAVEGVHPIGQNAPQRVAEPAAYQLPYIAETDLYLQNMNERLPPVDTGFHVFDPKTRSWTPAHSS